MEHWNLIKVTNPYMQQAIASGFRLMTRISRTDVFRTNFGCYYGRLSGWKTLLTRIRNFANKVRHPVPVTVDPIERLHFPDVHGVLIVVKVVRLTFAPIGERQRLSAGCPRPGAGGIVQRSGCPEPEIVLLLTVLQQLEQSVLLFLGLNGHQ